MGSLPMRLLLLSICMLCLVHPVGGQGGGVGSPVQRSSPTPSQETYPLCLLLGPWVGSWRGFTLHFHFHLISCCAIPSVWLSGAGPVPQRIHLILFCRYAGMPFLVSGVPLGSTFSSTSHACLSRPPLGSVKPMQPHAIWSCLESTASALASSECVRFWIFPSRGQIPGTSGPIPTRDLIKSIGQESPIVIICIGRGCDVCSFGSFQSSLFF